MYDSQKQRRSTDLLLVLILIYIPVLLKSNLAYYGLYTYRQFSGSLQAVYLYDTVQKIVLLGLLAYLLYQQGRSLLTLGLRASWRDIYRSFILLGQLAIPLFIVSLLFVFTGWFQKSNNMEFLASPITPLYLLYIIVNPIFEEIIFRAYVITEISDLTRYKWLGVAVSAALQTSYHIYQGLMPLIPIGIMFLMFSIYYYRTRNIVPIIAVHMFFDLLAMLRYGKM